jgi:hypothetical protein
LPFTLAWEDLLLVFTSTWFKTATSALRWLLKQSDLLHLKRITTPHFDVYFHLWHDGGAKWNREFRKWQVEAEASWQLVTRKKKEKKS